jgi:hypothetical protein
MERLFREQFEKVLLAEITELNGEITEEGLNMAIMESIIDDRIKELENNRESIIAERIDSEMDTEVEEKSGVYVYDATDATEFIFNRHSTVAEAVREAIRVVNALVLCHGEIIEYDSIDDKHAYYIDKKANKVKIVTI